MIGEGAPRASPARRHESDWTAASERRETCRKTTGIASRIWGGRSTEWRRGWSKGPADDWRVTRSGSDAPPAVSQPLLLFSALLPVRPPSRARHLAWDAWDAWDEWNESVSTRESSTVLPPSQLEADEDRRVTPLSQLEPEEDRRVTLRGGERAAGLKPAADARALAADVATTAATAAAVAAAAAAAAASAVVKCAAPSTGRLAAWAQEVVGCDACRGDAGGERLVGLSGLCRLCRLRYLPGCNATRVIKDVRISAALASLRATIASPATSSGGSACSSWGQSTDAWRRKASLTVRLREGRVLSGPLSRRLILSADAAVSSALPPEMLRSVR